MSSAHEINIILTFLQLFIFSWVFIRLRPLSAGCCAASSACCPSQRILLNLILSPSSCAFETLGFVLSVRSGSLSQFWNRRKEPYLYQIKLKFSVKLLLFQIWVRKISLCRRIELVFLECHQSKTVLAKQRWWKEIWMFLMACTVRLCSLARVIQYPATWQGLKASPTHGFWQKCSLVGVGNNANTLLHHLIITTALFTWGFSMKKILSH